jgi:serine/threonine-protein kinase
MLAGQKPFAGDSVVSITYAIMNREPTQPAGVEWAMWEVLRKALDKTPSMRYSGAAEMKRAMVAAAMPISDPGPSISQYSYAPTPATPPPAPLQYPFDPYTGVPTNAPSATPGYSQAPYGQAPPVQTPYGYSNQPYGQPMPIGGPVPFMPPPGPLPVYYPPPPRVPLFKPDTVVFLKKLGVAVLIIGTLFLLLIVALQAVVGRWSEAKLEDADRMVSKSSVASDASAPIEDRIRDLQHYRNQLHSPQKKRDADHELAGLYDQLGSKSVSADVSTAEHYFQTATILDPTNPATLDRLAQLYADRANDQKDPANRADLWKHAGENWQQAAQAALDARSKERFQGQAATMFYNCAFELKQIGDTSRRQEARSALYLAQENVQTGSDLQRQIRELLADLS